MRSLLGIVLVVAMTLVSSGCGAKKSSPTAAASARNADGEKGIQALYEEYQARDLANNPKIMELYSEDSSVALGGSAYSKARYGELVAETYKNAGEVNKQTEYSDLSILDVSGNKAETTFSANLGSKNMNVHWMLRRNAKGEWEIQSESFGFGSAHSK